MGLKAALIAVLVVIEGCTVIGRGVGESIDTSSRTLAGFDESVNVPVDELEPEGVYRFGFESGATLEGSPVMENRLRTLVGAWLPVDLDSLRTANPAVYETNESNAKGTGTLIGAAVDLAVLILFFRAVGRGFNIDIGDISTGLGS